MSGVERHLHVVRTSPAEREAVSSAPGDVGLTITIFVVSALPLVSMIAGVGQWGDRSLGLGTLGVLLAGRELGAWLAARCRFGRRP
jgi:hypothetical protein